MPAGADGVSLDAVRPKQALYRPEIRVRITDVIFCHFAREYRNGALIVAVEFMGRSN